MLNKRKVRLLIYIASIMMTSFALGGCSKIQAKKTDNKTEPADVIAKTEEVMTNTAALDFAKKQVLKTSTYTTTKALPRYIGPKGTWVSKSIPTDWTNGFYPAQLWRLYDYSKDTNLKTLAEKYTVAMDGWKSKTTTHDVGFSIMNSYGLGYKLTANTAYKPVIMTAADSLASRFDPIVGCTRSWTWTPPNPNASFFTYPVIMDNMMNLELLFYASKISGDPKYKDMAISHALKTSQNAFRPDGSTYHVIDYDPTTGNVLQKKTWQGYSDESTWSRGQAWAIYGFTAAYRYTNDQRFLDTAIKAANYYIDNCPDDYVPLWDFNTAPTLTLANGTVVDLKKKDSSAAAIANSGLIELMSYVTDSKLKAKYETVINTSYKHLLSSEYLAKGTENDSILLHCVGNFPSYLSKGSNLEAAEVDVSLSYGDYFFVEGLMRLDAYNKGTLSSQLF